MSNSNTNVELKHRAERRVNLMSQIADLQDDLKTLKAEDKNDGFNEKALAQCVKELLRGWDFQEAQLQLELELDTYRRAVGLPTELPDAQAGVAAQAQTIPEPKSKRTKH